MNIRKVTITVLLTLVFSTPVACDKGGGRSGGAGGSGPATVVGINANWNTGVFSHDLLLTNGSASDLSEVDMTITLYRIDGQKPVVKQFWANWPRGEVKKVNVNAHKYQMVTLEGKAFQGLDKVKIDNGWTWNWDKKTQ